MEGSSRRDKCVVVADMCCGAAEAKQHCKNLKIKKDDSNTEHGSTKFNHSQQFVECALNQK